MNVGRKTAGNSGGFTLLELLVVLLIASLVVGLIPPLFSAAVPGAQLKGRRGISPSPYVKPVTRPSSKTGKWTCF